MTPKRLASLMLITLGIGAVAPVPAYAAESPARIVSLAPSVTELLFALGLDDRVVGVTDWCVRPDAARTKARVGGHVDPNLEAVAALDPDLVVLEVANDGTRRRIERLGLTALAVEHRHLDGVLASVTEVGEACGVVAAATALRDDLESRLAAVRDVVARAEASGRPRLRALVVVGRDLTGGVLRDVYVAGRGTFLGEMLETAGAENACDLEAVRYPVLTREALMRLAPEVIVELAPELADDPDAPNRLRAAWADLGVPAARDGRVLIVLDDGPLIPGPGVADTVEMLAAAMADDDREATP